MSKGTDISDRIIHALIMDVALNLAIQAIETEISFLRLPVIRQVFEFLMKKAAGVLCEQLQTFAAFQVIDFQTEHEKKEYEASVMRLKEAIHPREGVPDVKKIEEARLELKNKLRDFIRIERQSP